MRHKARPVAVPTYGQQFLDVGQVQAGGGLVEDFMDLMVIKGTDWVIDLGAEGSDAGAYVVAQGTPEDVIEVSEGYTGQFLRRVL